MNFQILMANIFLEKRWNGKEYYEEKYYGKIAIKYEGKYLNGKRNGKGKEYFKDGSINLKEYIYLV